MDERKAGQQRWRSRWLTSFHEDTDKRAPTRKGMPGCQHPTSIRSQSRTKNAYRGIQTTIHRPSAVGLTPNAPSYESMTGAAYYTAYSIPTRAAWRRLQSPLSPSLPAAVKLASCIEDKQAQQRGQSERQPEAQPQWQPGAS